jgi:iron complex outermembrane recepter protein
MYRIIVCCFSVCVLTAVSVFAAPLTSTVDTLVVRAERIGVQSVHEIDADYLQEGFTADGASIVQRGGSLTSDLYMDGFKRGDFLFTVDGERHHTACPNRMDLILGRVNPLDMQSLTISRGLGGLRSGLAGGIDFHRAKPVQARTIRGILQGSAGAAQAEDIALSVEQGGTRVSTRYLRQQNWEDGDGRDFTDNYGFQNPEDAVLAEIALHTAHDDWDASAAYTATREVSFPYLLMDERENDVFSLSGGWRNYRAYVNSASHLMDNGLRVPAATMTTDVSALTFGVTSDRFEVYGRNWDADNVIGPLTNHLMPDVWRFGATGSHTLAFNDATGLILRAGLVSTRAGDASALVLHRELKPDAERQVWYVPFGVGVEHRRPTTRGRVILTAEAVSDAPDIEQLYIGVRKPMGKPHWSGNPELDAPLRMTARARWLGKHLQGDLFFSRVNNYVQLDSEFVSSVKYLTFANLDAYVAGASVRTEHRYLDLGLAWNWGQKVEDAAPLAEVRPLMLDAVLKAPRRGPWSGQLRWTHAFEQSRIDAENGETETADWDRLDLKLAYALRRADLVLTVSNLTDALYYDHLSFRRDPFSSGARVFDPGRTVGLRLNFIY